MRRPFYTFSHWLLAAVVVLGAGFLAAPAWAQLPIAPPEPAAVAEAPAAPAAVAVPAVRASARATMETFLKSMAAARGEYPDRIRDAIACLDLSDVSELVREQEGRFLCEQLLEVIDRTRFVKLEEISDDPDGPAYVFLEREEGEIRIARIETGEWLVTKESVAWLPALFKATKNTEVVAELKDAPRRVSTVLTLRRIIPDSLQEGGLLLEPWQWLGLIFLLFVGVVLDRVTSFLLAGLAQTWARRNEAMLAEVLTAKLWRPVGVLAAALFWRVALGWLDLPTAVLVVLYVAVQFMATAAAVWVAYNLVDVVAAYVAHRAAGTESKLDDLLVPLVRRSLKIFVVAFGLIFIADNLNINVTSLVAGIGLGGLAVALAAKDTVENLFGSLMVILDRPFHVGDWVVVGDVEGTVEAVGFRSTRIRTFYNSLVTMPNSKLVNAAVDNYGARRYRRIRTFLSLTYDTPPEKIEAFCEAVRELLRRHPYTRKDYFQVYLNQLSAHSLDVLLYCFHETPDWNTELRERHRLFLDILRVAEKLEVQFAFPTQTLHMHEQGAWQTPPNALADGTAAQQAGRTLGRNLAGSQWDGRTKPPAVTFAMPPDAEDAIEQRGAGSADGNES